MRRLLLVVTVALVMAAMLLAMAMPAFAATNNENACLGQVNKGNNSQDIQPSDIAKRPAGFSNAGDVEKFFRIGGLVC
jgi:hypothetical protein